VRSDLSLQLPAGPEAAAAARRAMSGVTEHLHHATLEDLNLLVSELVTNSIRHAGELSSVRLDISVNEERVRVNVCDAGRGFEPAVRPMPAADAASGWGLYLVDRLSDRWGVVQEKDTTVWFEMDVAP
jgi:anti-sigma regulatory factor (Ser/Thr protein kinase)